MKFDDLDKKLRIYETYQDRQVLPGMYMVARIDGRNFTKLTKEKHDFQGPFDEKFRDMMVATVKHLMCCGFNMIYGFTESDEISLLFHLHDNTFGRKTRKLISILAGEASAKFSSMLGDVAAFDCRISELPNSLLVEDYFRWRNEDAYRNALNAHCYWNLRQNGLNKNEATKRIEGLSVSMKNELLHTYGINFNDLPNWQKRGIGIYWKNVKSTGINPLSNETVEVTRRQLTTNMELPMGDAYNRYLSELIQKNEAL